MSKVVSGQGFSAGDHVIDNKRKKDDERKGIVLHLPTRLVHGEEESKMMEKDLEDEVAALQIS